MAGKTPIPSSSHLLFSLLRILLLDLPLAALIFCFFAAQFTLRCYDTYLLPQIDALKWNESRATSEATYYTRFCDHEDFSTNNASDLFLDPASATPQDAYDTFLEHGYVGIPNILTKEQASKIRDYVLKRNMKEDPEGGHSGLHSPEHRWLITLGANHDPVVAETLQIIANQPLFKASIEKITGPNPALIELDVITSSIGAKPQALHSDGIQELSPLVWSRSFAPTHVLLMQLQDTTVGMGATQVCPGTHYCYEGPFPYFCEKDALISVVNEDGYWPAGTGVLMNTNSYHRGAAYYDYEKGQEGYEYNNVTQKLEPPHRVMLVTTWSPQPTPRAEGRMLTQGLSYSLPWYQWGHTLADVAQAPSRMQRPWSDLRALGLYNMFDSTSWGVDYPSLWLRRTANEYDAIDGENSIEEFFDEDPEAWKVKQLFRGQQTAFGSWRDLFLKSLKRILELAEHGSKIWACLYLGFMLLWCFASHLLYGSANEKGPSLVGQFVSTVLRLCLILGAIYAVFQWSSNTMDNSKWAHDIRHRLRNTVAFDGLDDLDKDISPLLEGPTTFPIKIDVLIETRFGSPFLGMYNDFVKGHPGTKTWLKLIRSVAPSRHVGALQNVFTRGIVEAIPVEHANARFLFQNHGTGAWHVLSHEHAVQQTQQELVIQTYPVLQDTMKNLRFVVSDCRYGFRRETPLCKHGTLSMSNLRHRLLESYGVQFPKAEIEKREKDPVVHGHRFNLTLSSACQSVTKGTERLTIVDRETSAVSRSSTPSQRKMEIKTIHGKHTKSHTLTAGDLAIAFSEGWFPGIIEAVAPTGHVQIRFFEDDSVAVVEYDRAAKLEQAIYAGSMIQVAEGEVNEANPQASQMVIRDATIVHVEWDLEVLYYETSNLKEHRSLPFRELWRVEFIPPQDEQRHRRQVVVNK